MEDDPAGRILVTGIHLQIQERNIHKYTQDYISLLCRNANISNCTQIHTHTHTEKESE